MQDVVNTTFPALLQIFQVRSGGGLEGVRSRGGLRGSRGGLTGTVMADNNPSSETRPANRMLPTATPTEPTTMRSSPPPHYWFT
eukprot:4702746-Pyramimonas_sp.AAC.2